MSRARYLPAAMAGFLAVFAVLTEPAVAEQVTACEITSANGETLPDYPDGGNHRIDDLAVVLWFSHMTDSRYVLRDGSVRLKVGWFRERAGPLSIQGRRLDADALPLRVSVPEGYGETGFQPTGLYFPTRGCWEITGSLGATTMTLVVQLDVGRDIRPLPTVRLLAPVVRGGAVTLRWRSNGGGQHFDVAVRRVRGDWRFIRKRDSRASIRVRPRWNGRYEVRVRAQDWFGVGHWSAPKGFVVR